MMMMMFQRIVNECQQIPRIKTNGTLISVSSWGKSFVSPESDKLNDNFYLLLTVQMWINLPWTHRCYVGYITSPIKKLFAAFITSSVKMLGTYKTHCEKYIKIINGLDIYLQHELYFKETHSSQLILKYLVTYPQELLQDRNIEYCKGQWMILKKNFI